MLVTWLLLLLAFVVPVHAAVAAPVGHVSRMLPALDPPLVTSQGVYSFDVNSGIVLYSKEPDKRIAIGSLTKIATALVVMKNGNLDDEVEVVESDLAGEGESNMQLKVGDTLTVGTVLYGLLIPSGNDGANLLARHVGGQISGSDDPIQATRAFVEAMNQYARDAGLKDTKFTNPSGIDGGEAFSTAHDVAILFSLLMKDERLAAIAGEPAYSFYSTGTSPRQYQGETTNKLLGQQGVIGGKTGSTPTAGGCVVLASEVDNGSVVITAVLGSDLTYNATDGMIDEDVRWDDASAILEAMGSQFAWTAPGSEGTFPGLADEMAAWEMEFKDPPAVPYPREDDSLATFQLMMGPPVDPGKQGGVVVLYYDKIEVGRIPVYQVGG